jgi:hypothetical protein
LRTQKVTQAEARILIAQEAMKKRPKYGNRKCQAMFHGALVWYDSVGEANYLRELRNRERAGEIRNLKRQVAFILQEARDVNILASKKTHLRAIKIVVDAMYEERVPAGRLDNLWVSVVADYKGAPPTEAWKLKWKMLQAKPELRDCQFVIAGPGGEPLDKTPL